MTVELLPSLASDPTYDGQAAVDPIDLGLLAGVGAGLVSGGVVGQTSGSPSYAVSVTAGSCIINGTTVTINAAPSLAPAINQVCDRKNLVVVGTDGNPVFVEGTPCSVTGWTRNDLPADLPPQCPAVPANTVLLGVVYIPGNVASPPLRAGAEVLARSAPPVVPTVPFGAFSARPSAGSVPGGTLYAASDLKVLYEQQSGSWARVADGLSTGASGSRPAAPGSPSWWYSTDVQGLSVFAGGEWSEITTNLDVVASPYGTQPYPGALLAPVRIGARTVNDGGTTVGLPTVTSASANFTATDVGAAFVSPNFPGGTTILSVQSATGATLSANATASGSSQQFNIAPDVPLALTPLDPSNQITATSVGDVVTDSIPHAYALIHLIAALTSSTSGATPSALFIESSQPQWVDDADHDYQVGLHLLNYTANGNVLNLITRGAGDAVYAAGIGNVDPTSIPMGLLGPCSGVLPGSYGTVLNVYAGTTDHSVGMANTTTLYSGGTAGSVQIVVNPADSTTAAYNPATAYSAGNKSLSSTGYVYSRTSANPGATGVSPTEAADNTNWTLVTRVCPPQWSVIQIGTGGFQEYAFVNSVSGPDGSNRYTLNLLCQTAGVNGLQNNHTGGGATSIICAPASNKGVQIKRYSNQSALAILDQPESNPSVAAASPDPLVTIGTYSASTVPMILLDSHLSVMAGGLINFDSSLAGALTPAGTTGSHALPGNPVGFIKGLVGTPGSGTPILIHYWNGT